jgi:3',5'-cyclic AMP phosphodiesterase CpdA
LSATPIRNDKDTTALRFFVLSDWGFNGTYEQLQVASSMSHVSRTIGISFILTCGDNFQSNGVINTNDPLWNSNYENVYSDSALKVTWYPALGNHDYRGNPDAQVEYSKISSRWNMPARYYTFVKKIQNRVNARFIVLDTEMLIREYQKLSKTSTYDTIAQLVWLKEILARATERWIIVSGHHPVFSAGSLHGNTDELITMIKPLFDQFGVDFYICGHDHNFEHARAPRQTTDYIVTGTGGNVRNVSASSYTIFSASMLGFTYITLSNDNAVVHFVSTDTVSLYCFAKNK